MAIHDLDPAIPVGFLCDTREQLRSWPQMPIEWVIPHFKLVDRELIGLIHEAGKKVMLWTVNRAELMHEFTEWGVDAIITDETERIAEIIRPR